MNEIVESLRKRAGVRQRQANMVLVLITMIIVSGGVFLVYANTISERGISASTQEVDAIRDEVPVRLTDIQDGISALIGRLYI